MSERGTNRAKINEEYVGGIFKKLLPQYNVQVMDFYKDYHGNQKTACKYGDVHVILKNKKIYDAKEESHTEPGKWFVTQNSHYNFIGDYYILINNDGEWVVKKEIIKEIFNKEFKKEKQNWRIGENSGQWGLYIGISDIGLANMIPITKHIKEEYK